MQGDVTHRAGSHFSEWEPISMRLNYAWQIELLKINYGLQLILAITLPFTGYDQYKEWSVPEDLRRGFPIWGLRCKNNTVPFIPAESGLMTDTERCFITALRMWSEFHTGKGCLWEDMNYLNLTPVQLSLQLQILKLDLEKKLASWPIETKFQLNICIDGRFPRLIK